MKTKSLLTICSLFGLLTSCSLVGLRSERDVRIAARAAELRGIQQGQAIEARAALIEDQAELEKPQPDFRFYEIPVPAHTDPDGVRIEQHNQTLEIVTQ